MSENSESDERPASQEVVLDNQSQRALVAEIAAAVRGNATTSSQAEPESSLMSTFRNVFRKQLEQSKAKQQSKVNQQNKRRLKCQKRNGQNGFRKPSWKQANMVGQACRNCYVWFSKQKAPARRKGRRENFLTVCFFELIIVR